MRRRLLVLNMAASQVRSEERQSKRDWQFGALAPIAMSVATLALALGHAAFFGTMREADEGAAAHVWQLLIAGQIPLMLVFAIKWLPRAPRFAVFVLTLQAVALLAAIAPVYFFNF